MLKTALVKNKAGMNEVGKKNMILDCRVQSAPCLQQQSTLLFEQVPCGEMPCGHLGKSSLGNASLRPPGRNIQGVLEEKEMSMAGGEGPHRRGLWQGAGADCESCGFPSEPTGKRPEGLE